MAAPEESERSNVQPNTAESEDESSPFALATTRELPSSPEVYCRTSQRDHLIRDAFDFRFGCNNRLQDVNRAYILFEQAASLGSADALAAVAQMQILGTGVTRRLKDARLNLRRAIWQGSVDALEIRALCSMNGTFDGRRDYTTCMQLLGNGVAHNSAPCLLWTGFCFEVGLGVPVEWRTAIHAYGAAGQSNTLWSLLQLALPGAFTAGDPWVLLKMGVHLLNGRGSHQQGREVALQCFRKAAALGLADAQVYLAMLLCRGEYSTSDVSEAKRWLTAASDETCAHPVAIVLLARLLDDEKDTNKRETSEAAPADCISSTGRM